METKFTEQESLAVITEMIERARNNFQKGSGTSMVYYGCLVAAVALLNIVLLFVLKSNYAFLVWTLMIPGTIVDRTIIEKKVDKQALIKTHIDAVIISAWRGFGNAVVVFLILIFGYGYGMQEPRIFIMITPLMLIMAGIAEQVTGRACRFRPFLTGAYVMWGGALLCLATYLFWHSCADVVPFVILAMCMIMGFTVPGYRLNKKAAENV
ncbi:MAG: hypothetical protein LBU80_04530 [Rikenellaceae bacterium]|jgi:hypothetical protein|nr:hypothetical protein [Rikenellaceae bacterium]